MSPCRLSVTVMTLELHSAEGPLRLKVLDLPLHLTFKGFFPGEFIIPPTSFVKIHPVVLA